MENLAESASPSETNNQFKAFDVKNAGWFLVSMDKTAELLGTVRVMDKVEDWVIRPIAGDVKTNEALDRLSKMVTSYRESIPPRNAEVLQLLVSLNTSVMLYMICYLLSYQKGFFVQFVEYCQGRTHADPTAEFTLRRIKCLLRTRLLHRMFSHDNIMSVMGILSELD